MSKSKDRKVEELDNYILEAIDNIRADRAMTATLLADLMKQMNNQASLSTHESAGATAAKYVETLQRSNEQMVKLANLLQKREESENRDNLEDLDQDALFDLLDESEKQDEE